MVCVLVLVWTMLLAVASRRDFAGLEERRRKAGKLFAKGKTQAEVSRELGVSRQSTSRWYSDWQAGGKRGLAAAGRAGRMPKLDKTQLEDVEAELNKGPLGHGYATSGPCNGWPR